MAEFKIAANARPELALPSLLVAKQLERSRSLPTVTKSFQDNNSLDGKHTIKLHIGDGAPLYDSGILPQLTEIAANSADKSSGAVIKEWMQRSAAFIPTDFKALRQPLDELDAHLLLRSHIIGYRLTTADLAVWAIIRSNRVAYAFVKKTASNVTRWFEYIEAIDPSILETVAEVYHNALKEKNAASSLGASYEIDLPKFDGPMVTRFPPEPSGYLHIGHAKAALLNDHFAHRNPGGTLICRFDDTNPSKESVEFQDSILDDLKMMDIVPEKVSYSSDYFPEMYDLAIKLIEDGKAFADDSELGKGDEDRKNRLPSKRRNLSIEETLARFADMKTGSTEGQRWCVRARIAYDSPNGTLRDPVIYRCNLIPHHRTGTEWKIYPTYDFCAPILDSVEGVTVALRTNEYRDRNPQYEWMQDALGLRKVTIWDFSRLNFVRTVLSKRKLTKIVNEGKVWGWDDPRMPTIRGILRRGMTVPALREFILKQGPSRNVLNLKWDSFWTINKRDIDPVAPRHTAIVAEKAVRCRVGGGNGPQVSVQPKHKKNLELGNKNVIFDDAVVLEQADAQLFADGEEITLMNWGNAYVRNITKDGDVVTAIDLELNLDGDVKKTKKKVTWLADSAKNLVPIDLIAFDYLIIKDKLEKDDELEKFLTPVTEFKNEAFADCNVAELPKGSIVQFERKSYYKLDNSFRNVGQSDGQRLVFFEIPSGKA